ncbi:hypothetical protein C8Q76DRAFT_111512 [Earliella scabrosa]|nr:hypothetical protein C8Q76DRAFT_111512 [Earliella scabrosa]
MCCAGENVVRLSRDGYVRFLIVPSHAWFGSLLSYPCYGSVLAFSMFLAAYGPRCDEARRPRSG